MKHPLEQQFLQLLQTHQDKIFRLCRAYLYDSSQAEDLYQEVLINIWKSLSKFQGSAEMGTWAYRITVNTAISYNRKEKKQEIFKNEIPDNLSSALDRGVQEKKEQEDSIRHLHKAIAQLPTQDRLIIGLYLEDLSYKEIAEVTGSTTNLVGVRINRIKTKLTKILNPV